MFWDKKPVQFEVTQADIENGTPGSYRSCPIALAAKRYFAMDRGVSMGSKHLRIDSLVLAADKPTRGFVNNFDTLQKVKPFRAKFRIESVEP